MKVNYKTMVLAGLFALASSLALGAGFFTNGVPGAGGVQYPNTIPLTGNETVPLDTNLAAGINPASEAVTTNQLASYVNGVSGTGAFRNALVGGDFGVNPWQRGTPGASTTTAIIYGPDRFWGISGVGTAFTQIKQTAAADITAGFAASDRVQRTAAQTGILPVCVGQVLTSANSTKFQGQRAEFSFLALAGANFSATGSTITATIGFGTSTDDSATNFSTGTWAGFTKVDQALVITTAFRQYSVVAAVPAATTQIGVKICYTPVGTAGANDWFEFTGAQLDVNPAAVAITQVANTAGQALAFERRPSALEVALAEFYFYALTEPAASIAVAPSGQGASTTTCVLTWNLPVPMRVAPTFTAAGTALGATTWTVTHVVTNTVLSTPFLVTTTGGNTTTMINLTVTTGAALTAGQTCTLTGAGGGSILQESAEL